MTSLAFASFCFESATFPQLAQLLAVQFCPNRKIDETLKKVLKIQILFFRKPRLWSMGADRRRRRSRSHDPGSRSEPTLNPDSQDSGPERTTAQNPGPTDQETRSPSSRSGNSDSRERRRRKKRLRSRSRCYEQRSRWAILMIVFINSKFDICSQSWL